MNPNTLRDSRVGRAGERGGLPAAQRCSLCLHPEHVGQCGWTDWLTKNCRCYSQDDLGRMFARVHGGFGDALQGHAHNVEDAIADVRKLGGER